VLEQERVSLFLCFQNKKKRAKDQLEAEEERCKGQTSTIAPDQKDKKLLVVQPCVPLTYTQPAASTPEA
jgi:hypothetical protein